MERLTIDEVIAHCKRHTERMENHSGRMQLEETPIGNSNIMKQYWEHRQTAEWLEQLKDYKDAEEQGLLLWLHCDVPDTNVGKWIPCSERLPELRQDCLVTVKYNGFSGMYGTWIKTGHLENDVSWWGDCCGGSVIAWQPLPRPYKGE